MFLGFFRRFAGVSGVLGDISGDASRGLRGFPEVYRKILEVFKGLFKDVFYGRFPRVKGD